jgi:hypothetical protein
MPLITLITGRGPRPRAPQVALPAVTAIADRQGTQFGLEPALAALATYVEGTQGSPASSITG